ncbi:MAG: thiamine pyrophosphate-dependent dehydrogenase E1 component subunit alpha [Chloroflexi bacterium]|nr:thiamine pyrophosphate-dependent dehydrogenase E1 component subunit alpha [Chloroflexota bacterium]
MTETLSGDSALWRAMYRAMLRIRRFEEAIGDCVESGEIIGPAHLYIGEEAVATGVCLALRRDDFIFGAHRSHGHYLAKGGDMAALAAEIFGKATGCSEGRGGSMHIIARDVGLLGTSALVGGGFGPGVGTALASRLQGRDRVTAIFFGDGATEEGIFFEALNFAALHHLPVIFVCENNGYSSHLRIQERQPIDTLYEHAAVYRIPSIRVDGNDVRAVHQTGLEAVDRARKDQGPTFIEAMTYRWRGHVGPKLDLDVGLRTREELDSWIARCPIENLANFMDEVGAWNPGERQAIDREVAQEVATAIGFARQSPRPDPSELLWHVYQD